MTRFLEDLRKDHIRIIRALFATRQRLSAIEEDDATAWKSCRIIKKLTSEIWEEIVESHFSKEEGILFPELELIGVSVKHGPIELLLREHQQIKQDLIKIRAKANTLDLFKPLEREALADLITAFIQTVERHAKKEELVLYEVANRHIPEVRLEEMSKLVI